MILPDIIFRPLFLYSGIADYHSQLLNGNTSCEDAVKHYLARIAEHKGLNAFIEVFAGEALERARELDATRPATEKLPPLYGVVVGIKDVIAYEGHELTAASNILGGFRSLYSATAVERLLAAGAIIIGRQNCDEFAMGSSSERSVYGPVHNAFDPALVPGGSSGGSAVSVQAGCCMVSLGTDTGGSVRQPADFCGVVGWKPSYGRVSRHGLLAYASSFDQIGVFASSIDDAALIVDVIAGKDGYDETVCDLPPCDDAERALNCCYFRDVIHHPSLDDGIRKSFLDHCELLRSRGHTVTEIEFPLLDYCVPAYYVLTTAEASSNLSRYDGVRFGNPALADKSLPLNEYYRQFRSKGFGDEVKKRIMLGTFVLSAGYYDAYFTKAQEVRAMLNAQSVKIFESFDLILSPTVPAPAFRLGEKSADPLAMFLSDVFTVFANLTGIAAVSMPFFNNPEGKPYGFQCMCSRRNEVILPRLLKQLVP